MREGVVVSQLVSWLGPLEAGRAVLCRNPRVNGQVINELHLYTPVFHLDLEGSEDQSGTKDVKCPLFRESHMMLIDTSQSLYFIFINLLTSFSFGLTCFKQGKGKVG